jgi:hypothetical protein
LVEVVSLDAMLCRHLIRDLQDEDWLHIVNEESAWSFARESDGGCRWKRDVRYGLTAG